MSFEPIKFSVQEAMGKMENIKSRCIRCRVEIGGDIDGHCPSCREIEKTEQERKNTEDGIKKYGLKAWEDFTFSRYRTNAENTSAHQTAWDFNPNVDNLYISGKCGTGKSHLAYAATRNYALTDVEIVKTPELMRRFRMIDPRDEEDLIEYFSSVKVLLIDDLGVGRSTEFANQVLYEIIDKRIMNRRNGLIITSNLSMGQFADKCGDDRLPSRLAGFCKIVEIGGQDWRVKR